MHFRKLLPPALTLALLASCSPPTIGTGAVSGSITSTNPDSIKNATVRILDRNSNQIATGKTNTSGQYVITGIPAGDVTVQINSTQNSDQVPVTVTAGRVTEVPQISMSKAATNSIPQAVTGKVFDTKGNPVSGATVTDTTGGTQNAQTTTDDKGAFSLSTTGLDKSRNLEISKDNLTTTTTVTSDKLTDLSITLIANARTLQGQVRDAVFSDNTLSDVTIAVQGTTISTITDSQGNFTLRGVPFDRVTLQASGKDGYSAQNLVQDPGRDAVSNIKMSLTPYGNLVVHIQAESSPFIRNTSLLTNVQQNTGSFRYYDKAGTGKGFDYQNPNSAIGFDFGDWEYDNALAERNAIGGTIQIKGTSVFQTFSYPAATTRTITNVAGVAMAPVCYDANQVISVNLVGVPGGRHDISVSLTGYSIQKSLSVVIQPLETVSTDLIVLTRALANVTVGDIVGKVLGVDANNIANVKVGYLGVGEQIDMTLSAPDPNRPYLKTVKQVLDGGVTPDADGKYRLYNVPSGTRLVVAGVSDGQGGYNGSYVPNTISLTNVVEGQTNQAPDLVLNPRN